MTAERHERLGRLFLEASRLPASEQAAYLDAHCGDDDDLRRDVLAMLAQEAASSETGFMAEGAGRAMLAGAVAEDDRRGSETVGDVIGRYRLVEEIGAGGFGVVYAAEQTAPVRRTVALKIIKLGMDTREVIARFEAERQALALMDHPSIARVFDAGATDAGRPYFVMELVPGMPITTYCDTHRLAVEDRLALFQQACAAVQHAHQKGVIHRDLKPSNVLVTEQDGRPIPKIIDFGIAKATDARLTAQTVFTADRQFIGTPEYMSPEQAAAARDIDTRSDVYSMGVLLYELLTGTTPFQADELRRAAYAEMQRIIVEETPPKPSTRLSTLAALPDAATRRHIEPKRLSGLVRGDLDWIVMKALEKDRARRYDSAAGFAEDVQRYLDCEPVVASPPGRMYRLRKFARRNRVAVVAAAALTIVLLAGATGTTIGMVAAIRAADRADANAEKADLAAAQATTELGRVTEVKRFLSDMLASVNPGVAVGLDTRLMERILSDAEASLEAGAITDELIEAELRSTIAGVYQGLGQYDVAAPFSERALEIRRRRLGDDHVDTLDSLHQTAVLMHHRGEFKDEEPIIRAALDGRRRVLGDDDPATIVSLTEYAAMLVDAGRFDDAEAPSQEAIERARRVLGPDDFRTAEAVHNLGRLREFQGRYDEAEGSYLESIAIFERAVGPAHPATTISTHNLAALLSKQKRYDEAETLLHDVLAIAEDVMGEDHPDVWKSRFELAKIAFAREDMAEAERLYIAARDGFRRTLGEDHLATLAATSNLSQVYYRQGRLDKVIEMQEDVLETRLRTVGAEHPGTVTSYSILGFVQGEAGRHAEAEANQRIALKGRERILGPADWRTLRSMRDLARALAAQEKNDEAEAMYVDWVKRHRRKDGDATPIVFNAMTELAEFYRDIGRDADAAPYMRDALAGATEGFGPDHARTHYNLRRYTAVLIDLGRADEALALTAPAIERIDSDEATGAAPTTDLVQASHASALAALERWSEAETAYLQSYESALAAQSDEHDRVSARRTEIADFYERWNDAAPDPARAAKAAAWRENAEQDEP